MTLFLIILMGYAVIKVFFSNLKRGGILLIQIAVGSLYMFSVPRGYIDGFTQWCKQIIGLCLTTFLQATILVAGLMVVPDHCLLGLGLMLSAGEVPRIAGAFGLDTSTRANLMSAVYNRAGSGQYNQNHRASGGEITDGGADETNLYSVPLCGRYRKEHRICNEGVPLCYGTRTRFFCATSALSADIG
jgi:hypothetical protein